MLFDFPGVKAVLDDFVTADLLKVGEIYMKPWTEVLIHTDNYRRGIILHFYTKPFGSVVHAKPIARQSFMYDWSNMKV